MFNRWGVFAYDTGDCWEQRTLGGGIVDMMSGFRASELGRGQDVKGRDRKE